MDKNILCIAVMATLLTGCISNKVNHAHTTAVNLSQDMDKFIELSNTSVELNRVLALHEQEHDLVIGLNPDIKLTDEEKEKQVKYNFFTSYEIIFLNKEVNDAYLKQNQYLSEYFKTLPLILDDRSVDIAGLVKNIDNVNQIIDKNVNEAGEVPENSNKIPLDLTVKALSSGFKIHQYNVFKKSIKEQFPVIIKALELQRQLLQENSDYISFSKLNTKYFADYKTIEGSLLNQYRSNMELRNRGISPPRIYTLNEIDKINKIVNQPFTYIDNKNFSVPNRYEPKVKSEAYKEVCEISKSEQEENYKVFFANNKDNNINTVDASQRLKNPTVSPKTNDALFDIENQFSTSGDQLVCELINVIGLLNENKINDIEFKNLEKNLKDYEQLLKFVSSQYIPKSEGK